MSWLCVFGGCGLCVDMWQLVHQWSFLLFSLSFDCFWRPTNTNSVPIVKNSQTAKITIGVLIVTCLHRVRRIHKVCVRRPRPCPRPLNTQSHSCISWTPLSQDVRLSVCYYVCPSPSYTGIVPKRLNMSSNFSPRGRPTILVFLCQTLWQYWDPYNARTVTGTEKSKFSTNMSLCLRNDTRYDQCDNYRVSGALEKLEHETILQDRASDR